MPELPEVEALRLELDHGVVGRTVDGAHVLHPRAVRRHLAGVGDFTARLDGCTATQASRRGKYLWLQLDSGMVLTMHLGMSGQLLVVSARTTRGPHLRARIGFSDGGPELRFVDQRMFGGMQVEPMDGAVPRSVGHIAPDPLDPSFDDQQFVRRLRSRSAGVKRALLDQTLVSGIGNIYADEALWRARLHGGRPAQSLSAVTALELLEHAREVLRESVAQGGFRMYGPYKATNTTPSSPRLLLVYGREGEPCDRCGTTLRREVWTSRPSFCCPRCQPSFGRSGELWWSR
jgi:formamidopyrimidine-DNA glycosylase